MPSSNLPPELLLLIFGYLKDTEDIRELLSCARVNKNWHYTVTHFFIWNTARFKKIKTFFAFLDILRRIAWTRKQRAFANWAKLIAGLLEKKKIKLKKVDITSTPIQPITTTHWHSTHPYGFSVETLDLSLLEHKNGVTDRMLIDLFNQTPNLVKVDLYNCYTLTDKAIDALTMQCRHLKELRLFGCTGITERSVIFLQQKCPKLTKVDIGMCHHIHLYTLDKEWASLRHLDISFRYDFKERQIMDIVKRVPNLEYLNLFRCSLTDGLLNSLLPLLPRLRFLNIGQSTYSLSDEVAKAIAMHVPNLRQLSIQNLEITSKGILVIAQKCQNLTAIDMSRCAKITDVGIKYLVRYAKNINDINLLGCTQLTDIAFVSLGELGEKLDRVVAHFCELTDVGLISLVSKCLNLKCLNLEYCKYLTSASLGRLPEFCKSLEVLDISGSCIDDEAARKILSGLPSLNMLVMKNCEHLSDLFKDEFVGDKRLQICNNVPGMDQYRL
ncbi:10694_t:CDS:2 [Ambispora gerdemannii]|uniref:10694_t:CDS:1 n=1 Tax=Ambispora gerdemannii TaxID=144530 RepID=A0A9N9G2A5_9GLOM|nr:10694_t:CDS:2 [Ambispora gerdemannii]